MQPAARSPQPALLRHPVPCSVVECLVVYQALQCSGHGDRHSVPAFLGSADAEQQLQKPVTSMCQGPGTNSATPVTPGNKRSCQSKKQEAIEKGCTSEQSRVCLALVRNSGEVQHHPAQHSRETKLKDSAVLGPQGRQWSGHAH